MSTEFMSKARGLLGDAYSAGASTPPEVVIETLAFVQATAAYALADEARTANRLAYAALLPESSPTRQRILDEVGARLDPS